MRFVLFGRVACGYEITRMRRLGRLWQYTLLKKVNLLIYPFYVPLYCKKALRKEYSGKGIKTVDE